MRRYCSTAWLVGWAARDTTAWMTCAGYSPCPPVLTGLDTSAQAMSARCAPLTAPLPPHSSLPRNGPRVDGLRKPRCPAPVVIQAERGLGGDDERSGHAGLCVPGDRAQVPVGSRGAGGEAERRGVHA